MNAARSLRSLRAPDEQGAEHRAWNVVRTAYADAPPAVATPRRSRVAMLVPALILAALGVALSPAGASVRRWINAALGVPRAAPALFKLPAPGRLLVAGGGGAWTVASDGSARRIGAWRQASWSPRGLYIAVSSTNELAAIDPHGTIQWMLARPKVGDARWYAPSGYRVAYRSGRELRVVAGDGTGDHLLAPVTAAVAPAWRPGHPYQLSYVDATGRLITRDADTGSTMWADPLPARPQSLTWSANASRLLVAGRSGARVYDARGRLVAAAPQQIGAPLEGAALSPNGRELAIVSGNAVTVTDLAAAHAGAQRTVLSGLGVRQVTWSPDGRWLLVSWPRADQWVFVRVAGTPRIEAVSRIAQQFGGRSPAAGFPRIAGWCCAR
jgi:hypothetical protein